MNIVLYKHCEQLWSPKCKKKACAQTLTEYVVAKILAVFLCFQVNSVVQNILNKHRCFITALTEY